MRINWLDPVLKQWMNSASHWQSFAYFSNLCLYILDPLSNPYVVHLDRIGQSAYRSLGSDHLRICWADCETKAIIRRSNFWIYINYPGSFRVVYRVSLPCGHLSSSNLAYDSLILDPCWNCQGKIVLEQSHKSWRALYSTTRSAYLQLQMVSVAKSWSKAWSVCWSYWEEISRRPSTSYSSPSFSSY